MINQSNRIGRFTSSQIHKLMKEDGKGGFGAAAKTYIEEKRAERCLGRSIDTGAYSQDMTWGKVMEAYAFENAMGMEYTLCSKEVLVHDKFPFWSGSPDYKKPNTAGEMKCYQPKNFYKLSKALIQLNEKEITLNDFKKEFDDVYWQVVSNSILLQVYKAEIMAFTPTEEQLISIREQVEETNLLERLGIEPWQGRFISEKKIYELAYIPKHSNWPNMVTYEFVVPTEDIILLTKKVIEAERILG